MGATLYPVRDHQVILSGLEVLRLMSERMEFRYEVEREDIEFVLGFMRNVGHRCVDNIEELIDSASAAAATDRPSELLNAALVNHRQIRTLFGELTRAAESGAVVEFASLSQSYTSLLADLIYEERRIFPALFRSGSDRQAENEAIQQFEAKEREIREVSRGHGQVLRRLEVKYTSPHCI